MEEWREKRKAQRASEDAVASAAAGGPKPKKAKVLARSLPENLDLEDLKEARGWMPPNSRLWKQQRGNEYHVKVQALPSHLRLVIFLAWEGH